MGMNLNGASQKRLVDKNRHAMMSTDPDIQYHIQYSGRSRWLISGGHSKKRYPVFGSRRPPK